MIRDPDRVNLSTGPSRDVGARARKLVSADPVWQHATVTTFTVIIIAERVG